MDIPPRLSRDLAHLRYPPFPSRPQSPAPRLAASPAFASPAFRAGRGTTPASYAPSESHLGQLLTSPPPSVTSNSRLYNLTPSRKDIIILVNKTYLSFLTAFRLLIINTALLLVASKGRPKCQALRRAVPLTFAPLSLTDDRR